VLFNKANKNKKKQKLETL